MNAEQEIALQLTLKSIEKMRINMRAGRIADDNEDFSNQVVEFYNNIYSKLDKTIYG